ncbi:MAG: DNA polymerase I, partial [Ruminiclostridium sp.]|nr:DNA polymerase I [Ruminiclostridium sp.]
ILRAMGIKVIECEGFEADDILGTLAASCDERGDECIIATGDRDSFQLITDRVWVNLASTKEDILYTPAKIKEVYGVSPAEMLEVKALMGDSSDNIPGVPGIGEKTALSLIQRYHTINNIYSDLSAVEATRSVADKLAKGMESARLSRMLGEIAKNVPIDPDPESYRFAPRDDVKLAGILTGLEMFAMIKRLGLSDEAVGTAAALYSGENTAVNGEEAEIPELDAKTADYRLDENGQLIRLLGGKESQADIAELSSDTPKRTADLKTMLTVLGCEIKNVVFDTTLAAYLLNVNSSDYSLGRLCSEYGIPANTADALYRLNCVLNARLCAEGMEKLLTGIEIPLAYVLVSMEKEGAAVDREAIVEFGKRLSDEAQDLEQQIYVCAGEAFNIASPKQLGTILFEKLGLPHGKKTKTGWSTNADVLEELTKYDPIIGLILNYRTVTKLNSTYAEGLLKEISDDGRIHTTFKQTETRTGRISSAEPNIQNIPVRTELGREFRRFFTSKDGYLLVDADYSQIELRILAHLSDDKRMQEAFISGEDIHTVTASQVFDQPVEWVTPEMRRRAKA